MENIRHILLDNDNTLYQVPESLQQEVVGFMLKFIADSIGVTVSVVRDERPRLISQHETTSTAFAFASEFGLDVSEIEDASYHAIDLNEHGVVRDADLREVLMNLGVPISVFSDNCTRYAERVVEALGVKDLFQQIYGDSRYGYKSKVDGVSLGMVCSELGVAPDSVLLVDDNLKVLQQAKAHGLRTALVGSHSPLVDFCLSDIYQISNLFIS